MSNKGMCLISILLCTLFTVANSFGQQVIIGSKQQFISSSSILEFPDNDTRGIVLPKVSSTLVVNPENGTLILDTVDKKVKYYKGDGAWEDLSVNNGDVLDLSKQDALKEIKDAGTIISNDITENINGVLVLDSTSKALVLPRVENPHLNIISPPAGTIVFDTKSKMLCIFNGKEWAFWEAL